MFLRMADVCTYLMFNAFVSSDFEDRRAALCTLQSEDNCLMSFSLVDSDHGNTIYNLKLYGKSL